MSTLLGTSLPRLPDQDNMPDDDEKYLHDVTIAVFERRHKREEPEASGLVAVHRQLNQRTMDRGGRSQGLA